MGAQTRQVGGGAATPVANDFNAFLSQQLTGRNTNPTLMGLQQLQQGAQSGQFGAAGGTINRALQQAINQQQSNTQQPQQQTSAFQNAFQNAISGNVNDMSGAGGFLQNFFQNPSQYNLSVPQYQNQYTAPEFQGANVSALPTNFGQGQTGMADLSGFGNAAQSGFNTQQGFGGQGASGFTNAFQNAIGGMQGAGQAGINGPQSIGPRPELAQGMDFAAAYNTLGQDPLMERNRMRAVADMRARFGAEGAGALGTGAQVAEGNLNAELAAQDASRRRAEAMQLMGLDLNERSTAANIGLQGRGQDSQYNLGNRGLDANVAMSNAQNQLSNNANILQSLLGARGQDFSNQLGNRNADISQLGLGAQQSMFNAGQMNDLQQAMLGATLQNQGLGNNFGLNAAQLNNAAMQNNNLNNINTSQFQNQFNLNNAQNTAQFGQANNALNSGNMINQQQVNNQMLQSMLGQGLNMNQLGNQNTMQMLAQLFGAFGQSNALGTPQSQMVTQPSPWSQLANMGLGLGSAWLGGGGGNPLAGLFGGGGNNMLPQLNPLVGQIGMTPGWQTPGPRPVLSMGG